MALVVEAVNHFFHPPHDSRDASEETHRSQTPPTHSGAGTPLSERSQETPQSQSRVPMSTSYRRGVPSNGALKTVVSQREKSQERDHETQNTQSARQTPQQPPSPPLAARSEPSSVKVHDAGHDASGQDASPMSSPSDQSMSGAEASGTSTPRRIKVRDLAHIQTMASQEAQDLGQPIRTHADTAPQYEISGMPIENIIEMVAGLLTKITTTNDVQHEHLHRQMPHPDSNPSISPQTSSVLAFHGKNVPSITILSYLNRINKYCPTSYEVFLSLLVYFDRMTEKVNAGPIQSLREASHHHEERHHSVGSVSNASVEGSRDPKPVQTATPPLSGDLEKQEHGAVPGTPHSRPYPQPDSPPANSQPGMESELNLSHFFVVDSFNIHRLVIAGVTCASKFFSDIFYTNSRYAKVSKQFHARSIVTIY